MLTSAFVVGLTWGLASMVQSAVATPRIPYNDLDNATTIPGAYIIEFEAEHDLATFSSHLRRRDVDMTTRMEFNSSLFQGVSVQLDGSKEESDVETLSALPSVKNIWPVYTYSLPNDENARVLSKETIQQLSEAIKADGNDSAKAPLDMIKARELWNEGITGKGIRIGAVDTGIDYLHPALGGGFGPDYLVTHGHDLVGDAYSGENTPVPDDDPIDSCNGHGTHVAGIIAGHENPTGFLGVAPGVKLGAYRVFGCAGASTTSEVLIAAFHRAYDDGNDVITASIGGVGGWAHDAWSVVVSRIVERGVPCTLAAGNEGAWGVMYTSSGAGGKGVTAVGSVQNVIIPDILSVGTYISDEEEEKFTYLFGIPELTTELSLPLWAGSYDVSDESFACEPLPEDTPDLSGFIALVRDGPCGDGIKAQNIAQKGAKYFIFFRESENAYPPFTPTEGVMAALSVSGAQAAEWLSLLEDDVGVNVRVESLATSPKELFFRPNELAGGLADPTTQWGPTAELDIKPQFSAPGGFILSTYMNDSYAVLSGTSMATPFVAGAVALLKQSQGKDVSPRELETLLAQTAQPTVFFNSSYAFDWLAPVAQQGAGLINVYNAAHSTTILSRPSIAFNDTDHTVPQTLTISNTGSEEVTYELGVRNAATVFLLRAKLDFPRSFPGELRPRAPGKIRFSDGTVTVPAGGKVDIEVSAEAPSCLDPARVPIYSGWVVLSASNGDLLQIPFHGAGGSLKSTDVIDRTNTKLTTLYSLGGVEVEDGHEFLLSKNGSSTDLPTMLVSLGLGSRILRLDVVPLDEGVPAEEVLGLKTLGNMERYPRQLLPRTLWFSPFQGRLNNGSWVPAGSYRLVLRGLRILGDIENPEDWDAFETAQFNIQYM